MANKRSQVELEDKGAPPGCRLSFISDVANEKIKAISGQNKKLASKVRKILDEIIETGQFNPSSEELDYFCDLVFLGESQGKFYYVVLPDRQRIAKVINYITPPDRQEIVKRYHEILPELPRIKQWTDDRQQKALVLFASGLMNCLKDINPRLLRKCKDCGDYFQAFRNDERFQRCKVCSRKTRKTKEESAAYMRGRRKTIRELRKAKQRRKAIEDKIKYEGMSREEAERFYDEEKNESKK
jgi:hypothetical protein